MSCAVAVLLCAVLADKAPEDAPEDVDLCVGVSCPLGKVCEADGRNTTCVWAVLGAGEQCLSSEGSLGACGVGMVCKEGAGGVGFCAAADDSSGGTSLVWLWVLLPVMALAIAGALYYFTYGRRSAGEVSYRKFLSQYENYEMQRGLTDNCQDDAENPPPAPAPKNTSALTESGVL
eukprot:TRINITY_DN579_c0_g2_i2.p1 TRINITY_DN579_c0_g2~~TRINITY_DN579_c0_g2_i2.p1  ORF type:complete len:176 (+),score=47.24 TRINITY_DN579_c0_g2_i2:50-577(+)